MFATSFMWGGAVYSALAAIIQNSPSCAQSAAICTIAALHYSAMRSVLESESVSSVVGTLMEGAGAQPQGKKAESTAMLAYGFDALTSYRLQTYLQYSDWMSSMPLLAVKLLTMARNGPGQVSSLFASKFMLMAVALIALAMIVSGATSVIVTGDWGVSTKKRPGRRIFRFAMMAVGLTCLIMLYVIIYTTAEQSQSVHGPAIYIFSLVWIGYPLIAGLELLCGPLVPAWRTLWLSLLDVVSKAFLAIYVSTDTLVM
jgi:bacteriorhodopsin